MKRELESYVEKQAEKAENLSFCSGIKLLHIRKSVEELLGLIGRSGIFEEYTLHNISHIDEMLNIIEWLIPEKTKNIMTNAEWLMLTLSVYFHDLGMLVTNDEYEKRNNTAFKSYKQDILDGKDKMEYREYVLENNDDHFLYQEFVRDNHARRIKIWIEGKENVSDLGEASKVCEEINSLIQNLDEKFRIDLALICESHHKDDIDDFTKYKVDYYYGSDENEKVNLSYIAIILRISDLLHITKDRTPSISRRVINISNPISVIEWEKQRAVKAIKAQIPRNDEGNVDNNLDKDTIEITAYFSGAETAEAYFGLSAYLQYTKTEILKCYDIVNKCKKVEGTVNYCFPWRRIDESKIVAVGFETNKLQFTLAQDNILQLLVGHTLYNDSSVVVRELVQNSIDAVKLQCLYDKFNTNEITNGKIKVNWNDKNRELSFWDNGTGMTIYDIENYLLKVGSSKYRDDDIKKKFPSFSSISHFGIGLLTCFMIANDVDIITNSAEESDANSITLRKVNGKYLLQKLSKSKLDKMIYKHGTLVKLYVRNDVDMSNLEMDLKRWIILPEVPVEFIVNEEKPIKIGHNSLKEVLIKHLSEYGVNVDGENYDVIEKTHGNVTMAFAVRYLKYLSEWSLMRPVERRKKSEIAIGTCVEGIRVEFTTPGYKNDSILAIANIKNSKYQTNVARSALETDSNKAILSDIYDLYIEFIQKQIDDLEKNDYSADWAVSEGKWLMEPLLSNIRENEIYPIDEKMLTERFAKVKCMIVEGEGNRRVLSAEDVVKLDTVNIIECKMLQAAEFLLKEIRTEATLRDLINIVSKSNDFFDENENVICNFDFRNILHQYALQDKEVKSIIIDRKQRKINFKYCSGDKLWYKIFLSDRNDSKYLFVPKSVFVIEGLEGEIGVKTVNEIFLSSNSPVYEYILKIIHTFLKENTEENNFLLKVFLSSVFNTKALEVKHKDNNAIMHSIDDRLERLNEDLVAKMWQKVDLDEFSRVILTQNYYLYSINNWSRVQLNEL